MKRVNLFLGHYGTGKTNLAVNFAIMLKNKIEASKVFIYDLDIVNPYYRTVDAISMLNKNDISLIASDYANSNVDVPAMNPEAYRLIVNKDEYAIADIGGDDRGAYALGRFRREILNENNYDMFLVINMYRPETRTVKDTLEIMAEIEAVAQIKFTAIINNSNLGRITTIEDIEASYNYALEVSKATGLPIAYTAVRKALADKIQRDDILPLEMINYGDWV